MDARCKNCDTVIFGVFCHRCGEKVLVKEDFHVSRYIGGFIFSLTNLDSKFYRTLKAFLGQPGQLSGDYLRGLENHFFRPYKFF